MSVWELIAELEDAGGSLSLVGERVVCELPPEVPEETLNKLRAEREEVKRILRERQLGRPPALPSGVRLVSWEPKTPPVAITRSSIVTDVPLFCENTLRQLQHAVAGDNQFLAGNWSVRELLDRLEQVGLKVQVESPNS